MAPGGTWELAAHAVIGLGPSAPLPSSVAPLCEPCPISSLLCPGLAVETEQKAAAKQDEAALASVYLPPRLTFHAVWPQCDQC